MADPAKRAVEGVGLTSKPLDYFIPGVGTIVEVIEWYKRQSPRPAFAADRGDALHVCLQVPLQPYSSLAV